MLEIPGISTSTTDDSFTNDDYETPDKEAQAMAKLVLPTDKNILEPFAGSGQIVKHLPSDRLIDVVEIKKTRIEKMLLGVLNFNSVCNMNFFDLDCETRKYDLIITNPPFSLCVEAIAHSLTLLNPNNPTARLLFLMPLDWNCAQSRAKVWNELDAHIHHVYRIPKRVDYLINGVPCSKTPKKLDNGKDMVNALTRKPKMMSGRQCYDAVFDIRLSKENASTTYLF